MRTTISRRHVLGCAVGGVSAALALPNAWAQAGRPFRIGVLNDLSSIYADFQGIGSVIAARLAVQDFGGTVAGRSVEIITADHQNKTDVGAGIARRWFDEDGVTAILDVPGSGIALAVNKIAVEKDRVFIGSGAATSALTGTECTPNQVQFTKDTWSIPNALVRAGKSAAKAWFILTADYAFGYDLEKNIASAVAASGGRVAGVVRHPIGTPDFSSFLLQAQASGAAVLALANAGGDSINALKQAAEFQLTRDHEIVAPFLGLNGVKAVGPGVAGGTLIATPFYWNANDGTRAFAARFQALHPLGNQPNEDQAGVYAATLHLLRSVDAIGAASGGREIVAAMKVRPTDDPLFGKGRIRVDGRKLHAMFVYRAKRSPDAATSWDLLEPVGSVSAEEAFRPLSQGGCALVGGPKP